MTSATNEAPKGWLVMVYLAGDNNLTEEMVLALQLLLEKGADVNAANNDGLTPLHIVVQKYQRFRERLELRDRKTSRTLERYEEIVKLLLENGVDVNAQDKEGRTPLDYTTSDELKALLREHGGLSGEELKNQEAGE